jgi:predicted nucleic acid binding AN1-type Zn finger protein
MCSKCFREAQAAEQKQQHRSPAAEVLPIAQSSQPAAAVAVQPVPAVSEPSAVPEVAAASASSPPAAAAATTAEAAAPAEPKVSTRCNQCRKKVGLTGFKCKCGLLFCGQHRYAEAHDCGFDYKTAQREKLAAANPLVQAAKVERI